MTLHNAHWGLWGAGCHAGACDGGYGSEDVNCDERSRRRQPRVPDRWPNAHQGSHRPAWAYRRMCADRQKWFTVSLLLLHVRWQKQSVVCPSCKSCQLAKKLFAVSCIMWAGKNDPWLGHRGMFRAICQMSFYYNINNVDLGQPANAMHSLSIMTFIFTWQKIFHSLWWSSSCQLAKVIY